MGASGKLDAAAAAPTRTVERESSELNSLLRSPSARGAAAFAPCVLGRLVAISAAGLLSVEFPGSGGPRTARLGAAASVNDLESALKDAQSLVLCFENGDPALPIIIGVLQSPAGGQHTSDPGPIIDVDADGRRVRLSARDEIVLECGSASITLRRNGRVIVRGTYVETCSEGTNRIKGGQVRIN